ncbi:MAG: TM0106 family RecB-like putative nuclease [Marmoricola sp.]
MVLLDAYAAKRCPRRVHNEWDPTIPKVAWEPPAEIQMRIDAGRDFEADVLDRLRDALRPHQYVDLRGLGRSEAVARTLAAMADGADVVIGGWLPDDAAGGRTGRPDLLLRAADGSGYHPGEVKGHRITKAAKKGHLDCSRLGTPSLVEEVAGSSPCRTDRIDDYLQLAHYRRMLEACGHAASAARAAVIGTDDVPELGGTVLVWLDLDEPLFLTYSRTAGKAKRSALERYDHEFAFRHRVAEAASGTALVQPIFIEECTSCPWFEHCLDVAGDAVSAQVITTAFSRREWLALEKAGCASLETLADLDVSDTSFQATYLPEVTHLPNALVRLADVVHRARMVRDGVVLERTTSGPIDLPTAEVEVDLDVEWDADVHVYLWGALLRRPGAEPVYRSFLSWQVLDAASERALAEEFVAWLRELVASVTGQVRVHHYSPAEVTQLRRVMGADIDDLLTLFVDLHRVVAGNFFGVNGLGIKKVAPAFGFAWRDETPSGVQSQLWLEEARHASDPAVAEAARQRLLDYNEDDVRATSALRAWLREQG